MILRNPIYSHLCKLTGYYDPPLVAPETVKRMEGQPVDIYGHPLFSLQEHVAGAAPYVSVAMDEDLRIPYGAMIWIPAMDAKYGKRLVFRAVDHGGDFVGKGYSRADIRCATLADADDDFLNRPEGHEIFVMMLG